MQTGVLLDQITLGQDIDLSALTSLFDRWRSYDITSSVEVIERCIDAHVIVTNKVVLTYAHLQALPQLKVIAVAATGTNNIDMTGAQKLGIKVVNVKGYGNHSVAQHVFTLLLQLVGNTSQYNHFIGKGGWSQSPFFSCLDFPVTELAGKTLGIIGYGGLGQSTAKIASAFGMKIMIAERIDAKNTRAGRELFDDVLINSDVISLHCPLTDDNVEIMNKRAFKLMKNTALLINTARGPLIDELALLSALDNGDIAGAALDVMVQEPPSKDNPLLNYQESNLIITPHIAWASVEARQRLVIMLASNIKQVLDKKLL